MCMPTYRAAIICCLWEDSHYFVSDIKIVEFRNGVEGRASQISAVQVLLNSKDLTQPTGIKFHFLGVLFTDIVLVAFLCNTLFQEQLH